MAEVMIQKCLSHQIPTIHVAAKVVHQCRSCLSKWHHCSASPRVSGTMMTKTMALCRSHHMWSSSSQLSGRMMTKTTALCMSHQMWPSSGIHHRATRHLPQRSWQGDAGASLFRKF
uniref:Uncharacterized protein n=1 Tax=Zea mays TaxID=4577 RepID=C0P728_MAIZE|nr:unknown [Zea mays]